MIRFEDSPEHIVTGNPILKPMMRRAPVQEGHGLALAVALVTFSFSDLVDVFSIMWVVMSNSFLIIFPENRGR